jgi:hypothetical protein
MKSSSTPNVGSAPRDTLNSIGVLKRREIEVRVMKPLLEAFAAEFGRERVLSIAQDVIVRIAREQGEALATRVGGCSLAHFADGLKEWTKGGALQMQIVENDEARLGFNVTRCKYAEMYHSLGVPELGRILSCGRDFSLVEGFNPAVRLTRTQTIMEGAEHCDFRFVRDNSDKGAAPQPSTHQNQEKGRALRPRAARASRRRRK